MKKLTVLFLFWAINTFAQTQKTTEQAVRDTLNAVDKKLDLIEKKLLENGKRDTTQKTNPKV